MNSILISIILGIVEGLTEFIPVSSTGHMILASELMGINDQDALHKSFEVIIQLGAILAIAVVYRQRIMNMLGIYRTESRKWNEPARKTLNLLHVALGIAPALIVAFFAKDYIKSLFSAKTVLLALVAGGVFMLFAELMLRSKVRTTAHDMDGITYKQAAIIGLYQCISVLWPGFSRSGATISGGMLSGLSYRAAADFSFLIAIPIMCAATGYELLSSYKAILSGDLGFFIVGFIVSFVVAYIVVVAFLKYIQKIQLRHFAYYRFLIAALFWLFVMR